MFTTNLGPTPSFRVHEPQLMSFLLHMISFVISTYEQVH